MGGTILSVLLALFMEKGTLVALDPPDIIKYQLAPTEENSYVLYSFNEYKRLKLEFTDLQTLADKAGLHLSLLKEEQAKGALYQQIIAEERIQKEILRTQAEDRYNEILRLKDKNETLTCLIPIVFGIGAASTALGLYLAN
jgi:hypothetical protein